MSVRPSGSIADLFFNEPIKGENGGKWLGKQFKCSNLLNYHKMFHNVYRFLLLEDANSLFRTHLLLQPKALKGDLKLCIDAQESITDHRGEFGKFSLWAKQCWKNHHFAVKVFPEYLSSQLEYRKIASMTRD